MISQLLECSLTEKETDVNKVASTRMYSLIAPYFFSPSKLEMGLERYLLNSSRGKSLLNLIDYEHNALIAISATSGTGNVLFVDNESNQGLIKKMFANNRRTSLVVEGTDEDFYQVENYFHANGYVPIEIRNVNCARLYFRTKKTKGNDDFDCLKGKIDLQSKNKCLIVSTDVVKHYNPCGPDSYHLDGLIEGSIKNVLFMSKLVKSMFDMNHFSIDFFEKEAGK